MPSVEDYLAGLTPLGWSAYPECQASASLLASLAHKGALAGLDGLPAALEAYVDPVAEAWIPEVVHVGMLLAVRDHRFPGPEGEEAFIAWLHALNREILPSRADLGPARAVFEFPAIWSALHRGTTLEVLDAGAHHALLASYHPEPLFPPLANRWRRDTVAGFLVRAGAVQPRVVELGRVGERTNIAITWS